MARGPLHSRRLACCVWPIAATRTQRGVEQQRTPAHSGAGYYPGDGTPRQALCCGCNLDLTALLTRADAQPSSLVRRYSSRGLPFSPATGGRPRQLFFVVILVRAVVATRARGRTDKLTASAGICVTARQSAPATGPRPQRVDGCSPVYLCRHASDTDTVLAAIARDASGGRARPVPIAGVSGWLRRAQ